MTTSSQQKAPDGRPLYAYKWDDRYYERLMAAVRAQLPQELRGRADHRFAAMFCVYAAEAFRRRHEGGPWAWETVFAEIGYDPPPYPLIYTWVERGLRHFKRPLLENRLGHREFLVTLACEGGLPLRLLHKENAHLSRYFREMLTAYHRERHRPGCDAKEIARQIAARFLPASLRHDVVFQLSADLIEPIVKLQEQIVDAADPISTLDRTQPQWRDDLPLPVKDDTVEILLRNLVGQARDLAQTERQRWRWRCMLVRQGESWNIEQRLELPSTVTGASLTAWTRWENPPLRLRVLLETPEGLDVIALLTRVQGTSEVATYRCEALRRGVIRLAGKAAAAGMRLWLSNGHEEVELPMVGGQALGPLPWTFVERDARWEWYGEGSVRCRDTSVRLLAPQEGRCVGANGLYPSIGEAPVLQRELYDISGVADWQHPELGTCQIRCASQDASEEVFVLHGSVLRSVLNPQPPFLGMPHLYTIGNDDMRRRVDNARLEWRPLDAPETVWRTDAEACAGKVWLRYRDPGGALRFRRQVEVVPATTRIEIARLGSDPQEPGLLQITGLPAVRVTVPEVTSCHFQTRPFDNGVEIACFNQADVPPSQFDVVLQWPDRQFLTLTVPFPRQGAAFLRAGKSLFNGERVALDRLAAIEALVSTPTGADQFYLEGRLETQTHTLASSGQSLREVLRVTDHRHTRFALHRLQEQLASMLAMSGDLDAVVALEIVDRQGHALATLEVAQFDVAFEPDHAQQRVVLPQASRARLGAGWEERITVKMLPLWEPATTPIELMREKATVCWRVPDTLEAGPWWVLGYDGDWARFRPLLWVMRGEKSLSEYGELVQAIHEPVREDRQRRMQTFAQALAADAEHPDWSRLFDYLHLTRTYPAGALDLFWYLVQVPEALILALLRSSDEEFDLVWSLAEQLPFSWYLVPVHGWQVAAERHFGALRAALSAHDLDPEGTMLWTHFTEFRERLTTRQPFFKSVCDWIGERFFPDSVLDNSELAIARRDASVLMTFINNEEQALQARHGAEEWYPEGPRVMAQVAQPDFPVAFRYDHLAQPFRPVRCAPFVAAHLSLDGRPGSKALLFELRHLRRFDPEWFDNAFAHALCLGLAGQSVEEEGTSS